MSAAAAIKVIVPKKDTIPIDSIKIPRRIADIKVKTLIIPRYNEMNAILGVLFFIYIHLSVQVIKYKSIVCWEQSQGCDNR